MKKLFAILGLLLTTVAFAGGTGQSWFTDVQLVDQAGAGHRLYSDLIAGHTVVVNAFFTACEATCPITNRTMAAVQQAFADRIGKDIVLMSLSLDPNVDTPPKLATYGAALGARPGWYLLTGSKENVAFALGRFGQDPNEKEAHQAIIFVGNDRTGLWKKAFALADPADVIAIVRSVADDKG